MSRERKSQLVKNDNQILKMEIQRGACQQAELAKGCVKK